jgi:DNA-binding transcriptional MerR regulator
MDMKSFKLSDYMMRVEASKFLGVHQNTLRNWERSGRLLVYRHPLTGYRLYKKEDLEQFLNSTGN